MADEQNGSRTFFTESFAKEHPNMIEDRWVKYEDYEELRKSVKETKQ